MKRTADTTRTGARSISSIGPTVVTLARKQANSTGCAVIYVTQHGASVVFPGDHTIYPFASVIDAQQALDGGEWADYQMMGVAQ